MGTINKELADRVIAGEFQEDFPTKIVTYKNMFNGALTYALVCEQDDQLKYERSPVCENVKIYWTRDGGKTVDLLAETAAKIAQALNTLPAFKDSTHEDSSFAPLGEPARLERRIIAPVIKVWARQNGQIVFGAIFPNCDLSEPNDEFVRLLSKRPTKADGFGSLTAQAMHAMVESMFGACEWEARFMRERRQSAQDRREQSQLDNRF